MSNLLKLAAITLAAASLPVWVAGSPSEAVAATAISPCPLQIPNHLSNGAIASKLVRHRARSLRLCQYNGLNHRPNTGRLAAAVRIDTRTIIEQLTRELDALKQPPKKIVCPMDDGSAIIARFGFADARFESIRVGLKGCRIVNRGQLRRTAASPIGETLIRRLLAFLHPAEPGPSPRCRGSQLALSVSTQGENTTAWIGVTLQDRGGPCVMTKPAGRTTLLVTEAGRRADVAGNPLTLFASGQLEHGGTRLLIADRICGELRKLGFVVSATSIRRLLAGAGLTPAPRRSGPSWREFLRSQAASIIACDFLTVETILLRRFCVLFFIAHADRRVWFAGCTRSPTGEWVTQQARNLGLDFGESGIRFLIRDRDSKYSGAFDEVFRSQGMRVVRTPVRAPKANAIADRFVRTVRSECLDWLLILNRRHLERVLRVYVDHYNRARPHRSLDLKAPMADGSPPGQPGSPRDIQRRDRLGGLIHEYNQAAA